ncbi:MAG: HAD-IA family hydrolase [Chloroflexi bacterium]|nr:HAD-IA family hydrolase [Chloroflexota bacterium]MDA1226628.1 HAD-IA family hydrolase [Chloroflexota bacterium]
MDLSSIKVLTFDIGGTVFDWHSSITAEVNRLAGERGVEVDASRFANDWRRGMFQMLDKVRSGELPWMNADEIHRLMLDDITPGYAALELNSADLDDLNGVWHRLKVWNDAPAAIDRLRGRYTVVVLTVLSWAIAVYSSEANNLQWDGILSCEFLGHYKPSPEAYLSAVSLLGVQPQETMMVAAHYGDLRAAMGAGLHSAFVSRPDERGVGDKTESGPQPDFDVNAKDFADLANQLLA